VTEVRKPGSHGKLASMPLFSNSNGNLRFTYFLNILLVPLTAFFFVLATKKVGGGGNAKIKV